MGHVLASAQHGYPLSFPSPGWVELDPAHVWQAVHEIIGRLSVGLRRRGRLARALAISASVDDVLFVDRQGSPIGPAIMALDTRSTALAEAFFEHVDAQRVHQITGLPPAAIHPLLRLAWLREQRPADFERVGRAVGWGEWLLERLGVTPASDPSQAARSMAWDIRHGAWSSKLASEAGLAVSLFPPVVPSGTEIGRLSEQAAAEISLPTGMAVVVGGADQCLAALGAGCAHAGQAMVGTGSWEALSVLTHAAPRSSSLVDGGYSVGPYVLPGLFAVMSTSVGGGTLLRWLGGVLGSASGRPPVLRGLPHKPTRLLVLPHINGAYSPWLDASSRAAIVGFGLDTTRAELVKAALEGITFELRLNIERLAAAGVAFDSLRATGGGARSKTWLQLKADITGRPIIRLTADDTGAIGAACLAAAGVGAVGSAAELAGRAIHVRHVFEPRPAWRGAYDERFGRYAELYPALRAMRQDPAARESTRTS